MGSARIAILSTAACAIAASPCWAAVAPMDYLHADGLMGARILPLTQGLLIISAVVVVIIAALVLIAIFRRARGGIVAETPLLEGEASGWISIGVGLSTVVLVGLVVWTSMTMAGIANPPTEPALSIEVRGHQWWWEFAYLNDDPSKTFVTANEIHIPVGKPVRFALKGEDVIHTFWVPSLGGKIQLDSRDKQISHGSRPTSPASIAASARNIAASSTPTWFSLSLPIHPTPTRLGKGRSYARPLNRIPMTRASESSASLGVAGLATPCAARLPTAMSGPI